MNHHNLPSPEKMLESLLDKWVEIETEALAERADFFRNKPGYPVDEYMKTERGFITNAAAKTRPFLPTLLEDHSAKTAEELKELARNLSPKLSVHTAGLFARLLIANRYWIGVDPTLVAAMARDTWHGGKRGFAFLPDPADADADYADDAWELHDALAEGIDGDPLRILTGKDRDLFLSLPEQFTIYRGCAGVDAERAGLGMCWTLRGDVAEWFASRSDGAPLVVAACVKREEVLFVKAIEFEIVVAPRRSRPIKVRRRKSGTWKPSMEWGAPDL